jgi:ABC-type dipeptide/oligopeptide/nickel transport system permease component
LPSVVVPVSINNRYGKILDMTYYLLSRLLQSLLLLIGVLILVFFMVRLTGDPAALMVHRDATREQLEAFREAHGLNKPVYVQFVDYFTGVLSGDLGDSLQLHIPNAELMRQRLPATLELTFAALLLSLSLAIPLGILGGLYPYTKVDFLVRTIGMAGQTIPSFWLAMILIIVFAVNLRWLPSFGRDGLASLILPAVATSIGSIGTLTRLTRSIVLEIRSEEYIRTAHAKGLSPRLVALRHIAPNVAIPLLSVISISLTYSLGGSVYIETVFAWPGIGRLLNDAIVSSDFPLIQAITLLISIVAIVINLVTDVLYTVLDPRIRALQT